MTQHFFEKDNHFYITTPLEVTEVSEGEVEAFAFADQLREENPNDNILWLKGSYVEADRPNSNGDTWEPSTLADSQRTPRLMPVTVMHDMESAVGVIADVQLRTPHADGVKRTKLETVLAIWAHRFPDVAEEIRQNYKNGTLMQSMECRAKVFQRRASDGEGEDIDDGVRILRDVTFTGTGLIFGSRGKRGAYDEAHLEVFEERVASHHAAVRNQRSKATVPKTTEIDVDELVALKSKADSLAAAEQKANDAAQSLEASEKRIEELEAKVTKLEAEVTAKSQELEAARESVAKEELKAERIGKLGDGFLGKLGDTTRKRLERQAKEMSDEEWTERIAEVEEMSGLKADANVEASNEDEFTEEEVKASALGGESGGGNSVSDREFGAALYKLAA